MMIFTLLLICVLFGTLKVDAEAVYYYDSSNYKIINDVAKCAGNLSFKSLFYKHIFIWESQLSFSELNSIESTEFIEFVKGYF